MSQSTVKLITDYKEGVFEEGEIFKEALLAKKPAMMMQPEHVDMLCAGTSSEALKRMI